MTRSVSPTAAPRADRPATRQERRRLERDERKAQQRHTQERPGRSVSPMVLFTGAALVVGILIVAYSLLNRPGPTPIPTGELVVPTAVVPAGLSDGRTLGKPDAPVTIEIWSDFQCPACQGLAVDSEPGLIDQFVVPGTVRFIYHDAAFQGQRAGSAYDESVEAAARCAADQGKFWEMHDWIFANWQGENVGSYTADRLRAMAGRAGLDLGAYDTCMAAGDKQAAARNETAQGVAAGINQTPTLYVNRVKYVGAPTYSQLINIIQQAAG
jgi:protein-disulfide isomerase